MTRTLGKAILSYPIDAPRQSDTPRLRLPTNMRPQTMPNHVLAQPSFPIAPMGYQHQAFTSTGFSTHSAVMTPHSGIQQQLAADNSGYVVPSVPASRQLLGPIVPGYQSSPHARILPASQSTLPTPPLPRSGIPKAVPSIQFSQQLSVSAAPGYQTFLPAQSLPAHQPSLPTPPLTRSRITKATRTARATKRDQTRTADQRAARRRNFHQRLASVNGIVSPSRVPRGHRPWVPPPPKRRSSLIYPCARCAHRCSYRGNVRQHFPACVERNGNPDGLRWDDAINGIVEAPLGGRQEFELDGEDDEDWRPEDEWQEEEELQEFLKEMDGEGDEDWRPEDELQEEEELRDFLEEMDRDDNEDFRLEDESQEEGELQDVLEEISPVDEIASKDAMPIDPQLEAMARYRGGDSIVQDVLDQEFASMEENEMAALRSKDPAPEDFELEWLY